MCHNGQSFGEFVCDYRARETKERKEKKEIRNLHGQRMTRRGEATQRMATQLDKFCVIIFFNKIE